MKTLLENEEFCRETFALPDGFREDAVAQMARAGKRARVGRKVKAASALALMILAGGLLLSKKSDPSLTTRVASEKPPVAWTIQSKPFDGIVRSKAVSSEVYIRTKENVVIVQTARQRDLLISDEQLLQMAGGRGVGLLKIDGSMELTFLGP